MNNLEFGEFTLDTTHRQVRRDDVVLPISGKAFELLHYMAVNAKRPLLKDELLKAVWPDTIVEEANLTQHVSVLRRALGSGPKGPIVTLPGRGYQFAAKVTELATAQDRRPDAAVPYLAPPAASLTVQATQTRMVVQQDVEEHISWSNKNRAVAVSLLVLALSIAGWFGWQRWLDHTSGEPIRVVLAEVDGTTGDPILDRSLTDSLRMDLVQSPYVSLLPVATVRSTLVQMTRKPDDLISTDVAREVCERTNSQAVLHGSIARSGQHYLLIEEASSCVDGAILAEAKDEAAKPEDLPHTIDDLAATLRQKLGESRRSIRRFNAPLYHDDNTVSLDALKAYTQGTELAGHGDYVKAIVFFKASVAADPRFAAGWYGLVACYRSEGDDAGARAAITHAYQVRSTASRFMQFVVTAAYIRDITQDMYETLRNDENWVALYPNSSIAWGQLSNVQRDLARYSDAVTSSGHAVALTPENLAATVNLATGQLQAEDLKAAQKTLEHATAEHIDGDLVRVRYLELAYALHDDPLLQAQRAWLKQHPDSPTVILSEARIAVSEARFADAEKLILHSNQLFHEQGFGGAGDRFTKGVAVDMMEAGAVEQGKRLFNSIPADAEEGQDLLGLVYAGNLAEARASLQTMQTKYPHSTLWNLYDGPQIRATAAMAEHKPNDAAAILEAARPVEMRELYIPWLRGNANLTAGRPSLAEEDFRKVIAHPGVDPDACVLSLSWLGLGRALAAENNRPAAIDAYQHFLALWAHADPDAIYLRQAKQEFASLQTDKLANRCAGGKAEHPFSLEGLLATLLFVAPNYWQITNVLAETRSWKCALACSRQATHDSRRQAPHTNRTPHPLPLSSLYFMGLAVGAYAQLPISSFEDREPSPILSLPF